MIKASYKWCLSLSDDAQRMAERHGLPVPSIESSRRYGPLGALAREALKAYEDNFPQQSLLDYAIETLSRQGHHAASRLRDS